MFAELGKKNKTEAGTEEAAAAEEDGAVSAYKPVVEPEVPVRDNSLLRRVLESQNARAHTHAHTFAYTHKARGNAWIPRTSMRVHIQQGSREANPYAPDAGVLLAAQG